MRVQWNVFLDILAGELGLPPSSFHGSTILKQELGVDSFMKVHLACLFEDMYDMEVSEAGIVAALTVHQLFTLVNGE